MANSKTLEKLLSIPEKEWVKIYKELVLFAHFKLTKFGFEHRSELDNITCEDFAITAIEKIFDGSRAWDYERFPDVIIHLKGVIRSLISNHFKASDRSKVRKAESVGDPIAEALLLDDVKQELTEDDPETILISEEGWKQIELQFNEDIEGFLVFCEYLDGHPPREIAKSLSIDVTLVYNTVKRGLRILKKALKD
jgi:hypothetical protein